MQELTNPGQVFQGVSYEGTQMATRGSGMGDLPPRLGQHVTKAVVQGLPRLGVVDWRDQPAFKLRS